MTTSETTPRGTNTLLMGAAGTGKTHSIQTYIPAGVTPFVIFTEPGMETLAHVGCDKLHYKYIPPTSVGWDVLLDGAKKVNTMSYETLTKLTNVNKSKYNEFITVLQTLMNFRCDRCGEEFGDVCEWDASRALVVDSLTGLNVMVMNLVVGGKPTKSMPDWMIAQDTLERFLQKLCVDTRCHFTLIAHLERELDEVSGGVQLMASTLGKKLAPKLPRFFSDVIQTKRVGTDYIWSTLASNVDTKARNVPLSDKIPPTFETIVKKWGTNNAA